MNICVLIPTYNESRAIGGLIKGIKEFGLQVIVSDDGSRDDTVKIASACGAEVLSSPRNMGKGASLIRGYNFALSRGFDAVITMDGDGQHSCLDLPSFIEKARNSDSPLIVGNRMKSTKGMPALRVATNFLMSKFISKVTGQYIPDTQCGFRLAKKELLSKIDLSTSKYETESEILIRAARLGFMIESVPVRTIYSGQKSQINPFIDTFRFFRFLLKDFFSRPGHA
jgi:glycosyltransferase involved in cell wall biosynthesis